MPGSIRSSYSRSASNSSASSTCSRGSRRSYGGEQALQPVSYAGSHIGMTNEGISDPRKRIGFVDGMPPPDWFGTGASRSPEQRQFYSLQKLAYSSQPLPSGGHRESFSYAAYGGGSREYGGKAEYDFDDSGSLAPQDSISQVSSSRSRASRTSRSVRRDSATGGSQYSGARSNGFADDERTYFDDANRCLTRDLKPLSIR